MFYTDDAEYIFDRSYSPSHSFTISHLLRAPTTYNVICRSFVAVTITIRRDNSSITRRRPDDCRTK